MSFWGIEIKLTYKQPMPEAIRKQNRKMPDLDNLVMYTIQTIRNMCSLANYRP